MKMKASEYTEYVTNLARSIKKNGTACLCSSHGTCMATCFFLDANHREMDAGLESRTESIKKPSSINHARHENAEAYKQPDRDRNISEGRVLKIQGELPEDRRNTRSTAQEQKQQHEMNGVEALMQSSCLPLETFNACSFSTVPPFHRTKGQTIRSQHHLYQPQLFRRRNKQRIST